MIIYTVQPRDTWLSIANDYDVSMIHLMGLNANRKGMSDKHPQYANKRTFANNSYELLPGMTVRIPEKRQAAQIKSVMFERKKQFNSNGNPFVSVRTTKKKLIYDAKFTAMSFMPSAEELNTHDYQPKKPVETPVGMFQNVSDKATEAARSAEDAIVTAARHGRENAEDQIKQTGNIVLKAGADVVQEILSNPARAMLRSNPVSHAAHSTLLLFSPQTVKWIEGEFPIISAVSVSGSAFNAEANASINIFNGQAYVGGSTGLEGNTKTKSLDVMPSLSIGVVAIPQKYLTDKKIGKVTLQSAVEGTDDILGGASAGAQIGFRGVIVGVDVNHDNDPETGAYSPKLSYKLGLGIPGGKNKLSKIRDAIKTENGVDIGAGTGAGTKVGSPIWATE